MGGRFQHNTAQAPEVAVPHFYRDRGNVLAWLEGAHYGSGQDKKAQGVEGPPGPVDHESEPETET